MMETLTIPNDILLSQVSLILAGGQRVTLKVRGSSMLPFITGDRDSVEMEKPSRELAVGDIVLAEILPGRWVIHRIFEINGNEVILMGDGNIRGTEKCRLEDVHGLILFVVTPSGKKKDCRSPRAMRRARLWRRLLPVRRLLLAVYRRTILKLK